MRHLLETRAQHAAFSPYAPQEVLDLGDDIFALRRGVRGSGSVLAVINVSGKAVTVPGAGGRDLLTGEPVSELALPGDGYAWLAED